MSRGRLSGNLTKDKIYEIRQAFLTHGRTCIEADRLIATVPWILTGAAELQAEIEALHAVASLRGRPAMVRDIEKLQKTSRVLLALLRKRPPVVWEVFAMLGSGKAEGIIRELEATDALLTQARTKFASFSWPKVPRGGPRQHGEHHLLKFLAVEFLEQDLPVTKSQDGLFVAVALILYPADPRPLEIKFTLLQREIEGAKRIHRTRQARAVSSVSSSAAFADGRQTPTFSNGMTLKEILGSAISGPRHR